MPRLRKKEYGEFMIKLEHIVLASPEQMEFIIEGMRNPMNSWEKSDSELATAGYDVVGFDLGKADLDLMQRLSNAGTDHRKFMRMMPVYARITAPLYWWKEFDTYKVGTVANSCSTMHKIQEKEFTLDDFSTEHLAEITVSHNIEMSGALPERVKKKKGIETSVCMCDVQPIDILQLSIDALNAYRCLYLETKNKTWWWQMIQLLPSNYNQTRNVMMNYEVLANIYKSRKVHKLDEWREFCKWIESLPYSELVIGEFDFVRKKFNIPEETIDKINAIGDINAMSLKNIQEAINEYEKEDDGLAFSMEKHLFGEPFPWIKEHKED